MRSVICRQPSGTRAARHRATRSTRMSRSVRCPRRVALLVERRYRARPQPAGPHAALRAAGHDVTEIVTDPRPDGLAPDWTTFDVVVARGRGPELLTLLAAAADAGCTTLNTATAIASVVKRRRWG